MSFLRRIKEDLNNWDIQRGRGECVYIRRNDLMELIDQYERMESRERIIHERGFCSVEPMLADAINAIYHEQGRNAETTLLLIMETLKPLIEERYKRGMADAHYGRYETLKSSGNGSNRRPR
jgi:hypothetical protein